MITSEDIKKVKELIEEFFQKMTINAQVNVRANTFELEDILQEKSDTAQKTDRDVIELDIRIDDPQILIGERGQTLNETQKILRAFLNKKIGKIFYLNLDINDYKKKKIDYLHQLAKESADEAVLSNKEISLNPMSGYERRIVHMVLAERKDILVQSTGQEPYRKISIKPLSL